MANAQTYGERPVCQIGRKGATWKLFVAAGWQSNIKFSKYIEITQVRDMQRSAKHKNIACFSERHSLDHMTLFAS